MTRWPDDGEWIIDRYIDRLRLRSPLNPIYYRQALRSFHAIVAEHGGTDREALERWLRDRDRIWARTTLLHRVGIVNRFLDNLVASEMIADNPFATLRSRLQTRGSRRIAEALLSHESDRALEALRRPPPFSSVIGDTMREHIALMRMRGYRYEAQAAILLRFDRFLQGRSDIAGRPLTDMLRCWGASRATLNHAAECEKLARILDRARRHGDLSMSSRRPDHRPIQQVAQSWRRPHIYSAEEIGRMLDIAQSHSSPHAPSRAVNLCTMLVLLYCAGLRIGELARLTLGDVDLQAGTITIRETKFYKSRLLPLSGNAIAALGALLAARREAKAPDDPGARLFWHDQGGRGYARSTIADRLVDVLRMAGIKPAKGRVGPRIHDLRHTFVVHRILAWYRDGVDAQERLPYLATYLGHRDINSTLVYITVTKELLEEASERFRVVGAPCLSVPGEARP